jgi:hypothetical protein
MPFTITNLRRSGPLVIPLLGGTTVRVSPGATSAELPDVEAEHNPGIDKLRRLGVIAVDAVGKPTSRGKS